MLKLWLLPKVWLHGSQSTTTGGSSATKAKPAPIIAWFEHSIRWVLMTPFGFPVEPEVNRNFAIVSGVTLALAEATPAPPAAIARAKGPPLLANTIPGVSKPTIARNLPKSVDSSE